MKLNTSLTDALLYNVKFTYYVHIVECIKQNYNFPFAM